MESLSYLIAKAIDEKNKNYLIQPKSEQHVFAAQSKEEKQEDLNDDFIEFLNLD